MTTTLYALSIVAIVSAGVLSKLIMDKDWNVSLNWVWSLIGAGWGFLLTATLIGGFES